MSSSTVVRFQRKFAQSFWRVDDSRPSENLANIVSTVIKFPWLLRINVFAKGRKKQTPRDFSLLTAAGYMKLVVLGSNFKQAAQSPWTFVVLRTRRGVCFYFHIIAPLFFAVENFWFEKNRTVWHVYDEDRNKPLVEYRSSTKGSRWLSKLLPGTTANFMHPPAAERVKSLRAFALFS